MVLRGRSMNALRQARARQAAIFCFMGYVVPCAGAAPIGVNSVKKPPWPVTLIND